LFNLLAGTGFGVSPVALGVTCAGAAVFLLNPAGTGNKNIVTRGSVISALKGVFNAGTSLTGLSDALFSCASIVHNSLSALMTCSVLTAWYPVGHSRVMAFNM